MFLEQQVSILEWFLKDHVTVKYAENSALITGINYILLNSHIEDSYFKLYISQYCLLFTVFFIIKIISILFSKIVALFLKMINVKLLQKDKYCIWPIERHHNSPHSALFKSSRLYQSIVSWTDNIVFFNFSDIKLSLVKILYNYLLFAIYTRKGKL